uniref:Uncharacterized protein n=1 Tax=Arundo donax TaxID=35708 RepID=A0A0A9HLP5_ARUDO
MWKLIHLIFGSYRFKLTVCRFHRKGRYISFYSSSVSQVIFTIISCSLSSLLVSTIYSSVCLE